MQRALEIIFIGIIGSFVEGFAFMLFLGMLHSNVLPAVHPVGFWTSFVMAIPLDVMFTSFLALTINNVQDIHKRIVG